MAASSFSSLDQTQSPVLDQTGPCPLPSLRQFDATIINWSQSERLSTINQLLSPLPNAFLDKIVSQHQSSGDYSSDCAGAGDNDLKNGANANIKSLGDTPFKRKAEEHGGNNNKANKVTSSSQPVSTRPQTPEQLQNLPATRQRKDGFHQILAEMFQTLPSLSEMDMEDEASKFNWLLCDTEEDLLEIRSGCGVSTKLLHMISQTTYCAARMKQEPKSLIVPITAEFLDRGFSELPQWTNSVGDLRAIMVTNQNPVISSRATEAWRIAAAVYLQCRLLRLPRNHPSVIANLENLGKCISIMLTLRPQLFTQVPPLPAFLLGMLATTSDHKSVLDDWLAHIPLMTDKSSIRWIWKRIANQVEVPPEPMNIDKSIHKRFAWWEKLVASIAKGKRQETCLGLMVKLSISG
ncbi:hypothetical protein FPOA_13582 [Fusarium poae]|uniref:Transcription factor domain-containing protein n=1 Tax=Fusarium poae TaxID=36050 RepID=A0A1B8A596_FUSPO|nr:hypothetical protein FPOA_13582 [Fusarium poae]